MMFAPFINILFTKRKSVQLLYLIIFALADFGYQDFLGGFYEFKFMGGALLHFVTLYILARIIAIWNIDFDVKKSLILLIIIIAVQVALRNTPYYSGRDTSIWVVSQAVLFLLIFKKISFSSSIINFAARSSYACYCLQSSCCIIIAMLTSNILYNVYMDYGYMVIPIGILLGALIYLITIPIEFLRSKMFSFIEIKIASILETLLKKIDVFL